MSARDADLAQLAPQLATSAVLGKGKVCCNEPAQRRRGPGPGLEGVSLQRQPFHVLLSAQKHLLKTSGKALIEGPADANPVSTPIPINLIVPSAS